MILVVPITGFRIIAELCLFFSEFHSLDINLQITHCNSVVYS